MSTFVHSPRLLPKSLAKKEIVQWVGLRRTFNKRFSMDRKENKSIL